MVHFFLQTVRDIVNPMNMNGFIRKIISVVLQLDITFCVH